MQELAAGFFADAYVPTLAERSGNFVPFVLFDPMTNFPFPGSIIPPHRLYGTWGWRILAPTLSLGGVTTPGQTTVMIGSTGVAPPSGFILGNPPTFYDISTTAHFSGRAGVCINYSGVTYTNELNLHFFHLEGGAWVDRTSFLNTSNKQICATVTSLSPFAVFERPTVGAPATSLPVLAGLALLLAGLGSVLARQARAS